MFCCSERASKLITSESIGYIKKKLNLRNKSKLKSISAPRAAEKGLASAINDCWAMDFVSDQLYNGKRFRAMTILDMYSRESLDIFADKSIKGETFFNIIARPIR